MAPTDPSTDRPTDRRTDLLRGQQSGPGAAPVVIGLHVAKATRLAMRDVDEVLAEEGRGLVGDRYHGTRHRHVTVQSRTALDEAAERLGGPVRADLTRRNVTLSHGAVPTAPGTRLRIGEALLEVVRVAAPCRLLDDTIGPGAHDALRRRGGTVFRVLGSGRITLGDAVVPVDRVELDQTAG